MAATLFDRFTEYKIVAIIRGCNPAVVLDIVGALQAGGIRAAEITLNSDDALQVISNTIKKYGKEMLVGAGTVLDALAATAAMDAGAQFIISPSFHQEIIRTTKARGMLSIPGAYTPTEIVDAYAAGADLVKVFPASSPQYLKDIRGPLGHIPMMPTGGVNISNIQAFQQSGAVAFGIGSALVAGRETVTQEYLAELTRRAAAFVQAIKHN